MQVPEARGAGDHLFYFSASLNNTVNEQTIFELSKKIWRQCDPNVRVYDQLRRQSDSVSRYTSATQSDNDCNLMPSN